MDHLKKSFNNRPSNEAYRVGWDKAFGKSSKGKDNDKQGNTMPVSVGWCLYYSKDRKHCNWDDLDVGCGGQCKDCSLTETQLEIRVKRMGGTG